MTTDHIVKSFDEELSRLSDRISRMGGLAESPDRTIHRALQRRNTEEATQIIEDDARIDDCRSKIEELAIQMIARRQPLADRSARDRVTGSRSPRISNGSGTTPRTSRAGPSR